MLLAAAAMGVAALAAGAGQHAGQDDAPGTGARVDGAPKTTLAKAMRPQGPHAMHPADDKSARPTSKLLRRRRTAGAGGFLARERRGTKGCGACSATGLELGCVCSGGCTGSCACDSCNYDYWYGTRCYGSCACDDTCNSKCDSSCATLNCPADQYRDGTGGSQRCVKCSVCGEGFCQAGQPGACTETSDRVCAPRATGTRWAETPGAAGCVRVTTVEPGRLSIDIDEGCGFFRVTAENQYFAKGAVAPLDTCYTTLKGVRVQSTHSDAWSGSVLFARDEASAFAPGLCTACTGRGGGSTAGLLVRGSGSGAGGTECVEGRLCGIIPRWGHPPPVTVLTSGPQYSDAFAAENVLTDRGDSSAATPRSYWLSPDGKKSWFILDLGSTLDISSFALRNTKNGVDTKRSTATFMIDCYVDKAGLDSAKVAVAERDLPASLGLVVVSSRVARMRYVRFNMLSFKGESGGLGYFRAIKAGEAVPAHVCAPGSPSGCAAATVDLLGEFSAAKLLRVWGGHDVKQATDRHSCPPGWKMFAPQSRQDWATMCASAFDSCRGELVLTDVTKQTSGGSFTSYAMNSGVARVAVRVASRSLSPRWGVSLISPAHLHVRPMWALSTCR